MKGGDQMQALYYVGSISQAMRGKRVLEQHGIRCEIRRSEANSEHGCGYSLSVSQDSPNVPLVLRANGITSVSSKGRVGS